MKDLFEMCGECRHLSDAEVVYQITNSEKTSKAEFIVYAKYLRA